MATFVYFTEDPTDLTVSDTTLPAAARQIAQKLADAGAGEGTYTKRIWVVPAEGIKAVDCTYTVDRRSTVTVALAP